MYVNSMSMVLATTTKRESKPGVHTIIELNFFRRTMTNNKSVISKSFWQINRQYYNIQQQIHVDVA